MQTIKSRDVRSNRITRVKIDGKPVVLIRHAGKVHAFSALCPHALGNLARGDLYNGELECPEHGWRFDIASGQSVYPELGKYCLQGYEVREVDGVVEVHLPNDLGNN